MRKTIPILLVAVLIGFMASSAWAQRSTATLKGTVTDMEKRAITGVKVVAINAENGNEWSAMTDDRGRYVFFTLSPGVYNLKLSREQYKEKTIEGIILRIGQEITYSMEMETGQFEQTVVIQGETPLIETTKSTVSNVIAEEFIKSIPLKNRDFGELVALAPGVTGNYNSAGIGTGISINSQRGFSNTFMVDGISNDNTRLGVNINAVPTDAIQEMDVMTHMAPAEFGQAIGGIINIATRSGTNELKGSAFGFWRDESIAEKNYFADEKEQTSVLQGGLTLGGPIIADKLHFFANVEAFDYDSYTYVTAPIEPGEYPAGNVGQIYIAKFSYQMDEDNLFSIRVSGTNETYENLGVGGYDTKSLGWDEEHRTYGFQANYIRTMGEDMINEARFAWSWNQYEGVPYTSGGPVFIHPLGNWGKGTTLPYDVKDSRTQFIDNLTIYTDTHTLKLGIDYTHIGAYGNNRNWADGAWNFYYSYTFDPNNPLSYPNLWRQRVGGTDDFDIPNNCFAIFAQDQWQVTDRFTLNYGVRYEYEDFFTSVAGAGTVSGNPAEDDTDNIMPRVAFTWQPFEDANTTVRGGYGRFYDQVPTNEAVLVVLNTVNSVIVYYEDMNGIRSYPNPPEVDPTQRISYAKDVLDDDLELPYMDQFTVGFSHQFTPSTAFHADFTYNEADGLWTMINRNPRDPVTGLRPDPNWANIAAQSPSGYSEYKGLLTRLEHRFPQGKVQISYTFASAYDNLRGDPNSAGVTDSNNLDADWGPSPNDIRHRAVVSGFYILPWDITVSGVMTYNSAYSYSLRAGYDRNGDGFGNDRPEGHDKGDQRGDDYFDLSMRFGKIFKYDRYSFEIFAEFYNLTDYVYFTAYDANVLSSSLGEPVGVGSPREGQIGFRFEF